jgi:glycerol 2-dehydrogenase (NADP+)
VILQGRGNVSLEVYPQFLFSHFLHTLPSSAPKGEVEKAVAHAIKSGYTHIDGAHCYQNEEEVGQGIKDSGVAREKLFLVSKLWCTDHRTPEKAVDATLKALGTNYLDLYLMQ